jgi:methyltransferase (TIGR00027 family)
VRRGRSSKTAEWVAFARAMATLEEGPLHVDDPAARTTLPFALARIVRGAERRLTGPLVRKVVHATSGGLVAHIALRTQAIDRAVLDATQNAGVRQVVILGAGLDLRAHRLPLPNGTTVFEVDHPATQAHKRASLARATGDTKPVTYVRVDFERDDLAKALESAGHDTSRPSAWIWEGVTMYLPREATRATLQVIANRSTSGSVLAMTYFEDGKTAAHRAFLAAARTPFRLIGEPLIGAMSASKLREELARVGFEIDSSRGDTEWAFDAGIRVPLIDAFLAEKLVLAARRHV